MKLALHYRNQPFSYFFISMLALILLSPLVEGHRYGVIFIQILFTLMMATAVYAASERRSHQIVALGLAVPWLFLSWLGKLGIMAVPVLVPSGLVIILNIFVGCVIFQRVATVHEIDHNILAGGLGLYLLIAVSWAMSFVLIEALIPGSFAAGETSIPWHKYLYFSLTTITTLGYGDILPTSPFARIWSTMEAVTGVLYIAVLVARLVSLLRYGAPLTRVNAD